MKSEFTPYIDPSALYAFTWPALTTHKHVDDFQMCEANLGFRCSLTAEFSGRKSVDIVYSGDLDVMAHAYLAYY